MKITKNMNDKIYKSVSTVGTKSWHQGFSANCQTESRGWKLIGTGTLHVHITSCKVCLESVDSYYKNLVSDY